MNVIGHHYLSSFSNVHTTHTARRMDRIATVRGKVHAMRPVCYFRVLVPANQKLDLAKTQGCVFAAVTSVHPQPEYSMSNQSNSISLNAIPSRKKSIVMSSDLYLHRVPKTCTQVHSITICHLKSLGRVSKS